MSEHEHEHRHDEHGGEVQREVNIEIIVGGEQHDWHHHAITYDELLSLLFPNGVGSEKYPHSISFSVPGIDDGVVHHDESVTVVPGIKFYVRSAHKS